MKKSTKATTSKAGPRHESKPADPKMINMVEKRGVASNKQGIRYGSRQAGGANEHAEKQKASAENYGGRKPSHHTNERRITKG